MGYVLRVTRTFEKSFRSLDGVTWDRVNEALLMLVDSPYLGKSLRGPLSGRFSLRVGDYRLVYVVDEVERVVTVLDVQHRRSVYR